jgi:uncharacterized protein (UPF0333 family)
MKPNNVVIVLIAVVVIGGVIFYFGKNQTTKTGKETTKDQIKNNVFSSIKDAMLKSISLKCEYKTVDSEATAYIKGNMIRIDGVYKGKNRNTTIIKDKKIWTWDVDKKEGTILPIIQDQEDEKASDEKYIEDIEKQKQFCKTAAFSNTVFNLPTDVKLEDMTSLFENLQKAQ